MTPLEIEFIEKTIGSEPKEFYYFRDKYALQLLQYFIKDKIRISELKASPMKNFMDKEPVQKILKQCGDGWLRENNLSDYYSDNGFAFNYSLSRWGEFFTHRNDEWYQTSRSGINLVLQLNFDSWHNFKYHELVKKHDPYDDPFMFDSHPIVEKGNFTLAWSRLDINLDSGEVLIEEIQNDWLREANFFAKILEKSIQKEKGNKPQHWFFDTYSASDFLQYIKLMERYQRIWAEAILSLTIHFLKEQIGVDKIYYHDFESGNTLKSLQYSKPPKSLYTVLPKKFGFEKTTETPYFLKKEKYLRKKLRNNDLKWWLLNV